MKVSFFNYVLIICACMLFGCYGIIEVPGEPEPVEPPVANTYVNVPYAIKVLIAPYVEGYFSPQLYRYGEYLYPSNTPYDPDDLPCYVKADFNGDYHSDYAFLFSTDECSFDTWYVTTKLIVVLSTPHGYTVSVAETIGTAYADISVPIEEFWSISYVPSGYHTLITIIGGEEIIETVYLENDGFFLASLDPDDEILFYAEYDEVFGIEWFTERLEKRSQMGARKEPEKKELNHFKEKRKIRKQMLVK